MKIYTRNKQNRTDHAYNIFGCSSRHILLDFKLNNVTLPIENKAAVEFCNSTMTTVKTWLRKKNLLKLTKIT